VTQLPLWLAASLLLVSGLVCLAWRLWRQLQTARADAARAAQLHLAAMEALAMAIEAKDHTAHNHIRRMQVYSTGLARALGMSDAEIEAVRTAALLHDIGKLAVPEHILHKPGPLTPEEFQKVRVHPQIGAEIIAAVPFPYPVAPLILAHHERWDGRGYPAGLAGDQIPLGARILGLVEYYDALTSDRPYHRAISVEAAVAVLQQESGRAFEPRIVQLFLDILPGLLEAVRTANAQLPSFSVPAAEPSAGGGTPLSGGAARGVFADIALAHREIYGLYEVAQAMGTSLGVADTMTLITTRLSNLVPFSACALFLYSEESDTLDCRFAAGTDADLIQPLVLRNGQGLTGWVARNRRPLVNARPITDLEAAGSSQATALQSALVCPLMSGSRLVGTMAVYHTTAAFYRDDHRRLLDRVCEQAGAVIHNSVVFEQTHEASLTDPLTGLPNTRFMFMHLSRELARAKRLESEVSLVVLDLNDFKEINDTWGHQIGDRALREVALVLRTAIRPYDICVRYAGDEFIVVLAGCGREEAEHKRRELQLAVENLVFAARSDSPLSLSISAGAAVFPHDGDSYEALLTTADSRMYRDKNARKRELQRQAAASDESSTAVPHPR
jgi:diguanylate cyclase (GGDEF)-like protein/putative nucleotidyltransferase with HDIG domain